MYTHFHPPTAHALGTEQYNTNKLNNQCRQVSWMYDPRLGREGVGEGHTLDSFT